MSKKPKPFNNPFGNLKLPSKQESPPSNEVKAKKAKKSAPKPSKQAPAQPKGSTQQASIDVYDRKLFLDAVGDAMPMQDRERRAPAEDFEFKPSTDRSKLEDSMALDELRALVGQEITWITHREEEEVEGRIESVSSQILRSLKRGEYEPMRKIDLHGHTVPEALRKLKSWIFEARADGVRCGLIITGRGHHSDGGIGVLQQEIPQSLQESPLSTHLLAFATAMPKHGGPGALYVLLRKRK